MDKEREVMVDHCRDDLMSDESDKVKSLRLQAQFYENKALRANNRMFWALNVVILSLLFQAFFGSWALFLIILVLGVLLVICADYYCERRLWTFDFFKASWRCLVDGWASRLRKSPHT